MLQRICDRCGKLIKSEVDVKSYERPPDMCLVRLDIGPFRIGYIGDGAVKRKVIDATNVKEYELCKTCKDELMIWLTDSDKKRSANA